VRFCLFAAVLLISAGASAQSDFDRIEELWREGNFSSALTELHKTDNTDDARYLLWSYRLQTDADAADEAFVQLTQSLADMPTRTRSEVVGDRCWQLFAVAEYDSALALLLQQTTVDPGLSEEKQLLRGLLLAQTHRLQSARDVLHTIRSNDPDYCWAQLQLAQIALRNEETLLARDHVDQALDADDNLCRPDALATLWQLIITADPKRAKAIEQELHRDHPGSFATAKVASAARQRERLLSAQIDEASGIASADTLDVEPDGDYTLELGRFSDRGRALAFVVDWQDYMSDLHVQSQKDERGHMQYRVIGGAFGSRSRAAMMANRVFGDVDISPRVVDLRSGW
jgi:hypothetical protein